MWYYYPRLIHPKILSKLVELNFIILKKIYYFLQDYWVAHKFTIYASLFFVIIAFESITTLMGLMDYLHNGEKNFLKTILKRIWLNHKWLMVKFL